MKTVIISGAGSGIGRATAVALAQQGIRIILLGRRKALLEEVRASLPDQHEHVVICADVSQRHALRAAFADLQLEQMNLWAVIANAGIAGGNEYGDHDRWDDIIDTNLTGTYQLVNEALSALRQSKEEYRHVLVLSSILGRLGVPYYSAYCASKAGLLGLTRSWAAEWAKEKILVNAICPGWVETAMSRSGITAMAKASGKSYEEAYREQMAYVPLGKMSQPEEIAGFMKDLLCSGQTSFTGQEFHMNNGALMV